MWYDKQQLLSHNKIMNMVLSNRGGGKTFDFTRFAIDKFKKKKKQTMWVRRYTNELKGTDGKPGILDDDAFFKAVIKEGLYPDDKFEIKGNMGYINDEPAIWFVALSTSRGLKSMNFPDVDLIVFDEFLVTKGKSSYLPNEVEIFLDLYETVNRMRDDRYAVRSVLLANNVTVVNPYFLYFKIKPKLDQRFTVKGEICVEFFLDEEYTEKKRNTAFGRLTAGTRYGQYAIENKALLDNDTFIQEKSTKAEFMLGMKYDGVMYGFWADYSEGLIFVNRQYDPSSYSLYCLTKEDHDANLLLIKSLSDSKRVQRIVFAFRNGLIRFSDMQVKNQFYEYIGFFVR